MDTSTGISRIADIHYHGRMVENTRYRVQCKHCGKEMSGITRLKDHLGGVGPDVKKCLQVPTEVKRYWRKQVLERRKRNKNKRVDTSSSSNGARRRTSRRGTRRTTRVRASQDSHDSKPCYEKKLIHVRPGVEEEFYFFNCQRCWFVWEESRRCMLRGREPTSPNKGIPLFKGLRYDPPEQSFPQARRASFSAPGPSRPRRADIITCAQLRAALVDEESDESDYSVNDSLALVPVNSLVPVENNIDVEELDEDFLELRLGKRRRQKPSPKKTAVYTMYDYIGDSIPVSIPIRTSAFSRHPNAASLGLVTVAEKPNGRPLRLETGVTFIERRPGPGRPLGSKNKHKNKGKEKVL